MRLTRFICGAVIAITGMGAGMGAGLAAAPAWAQGETPPAPQPASPSLNSMPHWSEFPVAPTGVPTAADIKQRVQAQEAAKAQLQMQFKALTWDDYAPDAFVTAVRSQLDPAMLAPVDTPLNAQQLDEMAAALRAKAAPPPLAD